MTDHQTDIVVIGESDYDEDGSGSSSGSFDDPIVISDDDDEQYLAPFFMNTIVEEVTETVIDLSDDDPELPSAETIIKRSPTTPVAMETTILGTPYCPHFIKTPKLEEIETSQPREITPILQKLKRDMDVNDHSPLKFKFSPMKKFKLVISKVEKPVHTPLTRDETLQLYPPTSHFVCPSFDTRVCLFNNHILDYIDSVSDTSLSECMERFVSHQHAPPTGFIVNLLKRLIDSKNPHVTLSVYCLLRQCVVLSTPLLSQQEVHDVLDHIVTNMDQQPGISLAMSLVISIVDQLERGRVGKPIFRHVGKWNNQLCGWLMPCMTRPTIQTELELCLSLLTQLQQLITLYCLDIQDTSVKEKLATSWVNIYKASTYTQRRNLLQNMGDHEMRALLLDKLLALLFPDTRLMTKQDCVVWCSQSPSVAKTIHLHFHRQPASDVSEFLMLLGYLLQSCIMSHLSTEYRLSIDTQLLKEQGKILKDRLVAREEDILFVNLPLELADVLYVS